MWNRVVNFCEALSWGEVAGLALGFIMAGAIIASLLAALVVLITS